MQIYLVISVIISIFAVTFAFQNNSIVNVVFLDWSMEGSLALVLLMAFGLGIVVSLIVSIPAAVKTSIALSNLKRKVKKLETGIDEKPQKSFFEDFINAVGKIFKFNKKEKSSEIKEKLESKDNKNQENPQN